MSFGYGWEWEGPYFVVTDEIIGRQTSAMPSMVDQVPSGTTILKVESRVPEEEWSSQKLKDLAKQLRNHRAKLPAVGTQEDDTVASSVGMSVSEARRKYVNDVLPTKKRAAVLVCLYQGKDEELRVILTKRSARLKSHSGEVALPGGKRDEDDVDDIATALREAHEEIALQPSHVRVVTTLEPFISKNLLTVIPVVGLLDDINVFVPYANPGEVDAIFDCPLEMFLKDENYWFKEVEWLGVKYRVHFFDYTAATGEKFLVWGLTASMLIRTASIIYNRKPDFPEVAPNFEKMMASARGLGCTPVTRPTVTEVPAFTNRA